MDWQGCLWQLEGYDDGRTGERFVWFLYTSVLSRVLYELVSVCSAMKSRKLSFVNLIRSFVLTHMTVYTPKRFKTCVDLPHPGV